MLKKINSRLGFMFIAIIIELVVLVLLYNKFSGYLGGIEIILRLLSVLIVLGIISFSRHLSADLMWVIIVMLIPVGGTAVFLFLEFAKRISSTTYKHIKNKTQEAEKYYVTDESVFSRALTNERLSGHFRYLRNSAKFAVYENTGFDYYPIGELGFEAIKEELRKASEYIFLEYFIIEPGEMWDSMLEILREKVREGVEVRVIYDDVGSLNTLPEKYALELEEEGIYTQAFNRVSPFLNGIMNHRDHRKILVIDGKCAFSGGINLADEYINKKMKFGHWKDNVIRIKGDAVWSYTVMFLTTWNALRHSDIDFRAYKTGYLPLAENLVSSSSEPGTQIITYTPPHPNADGFIVPYADTPLDNDLVGENVYLNIINSANKYCYIMTPYLIIDSEMSNALILAAQRGVDVRIVTPGIPDKKLIWQITRSYYPILISGGVKIYEYTPGFVHSKVFVSDDIMAAVGTINLDFRSLYLHFENGTALYESEKIMDIKKDVQNTIENSRPVQSSDLIGKKFTLIKSFIIMILRIFAPFM